MSSASILPRRQGKSTRVGHIKRARTSAAAMVIVAALALVSACTETRRDTKPGAVFITTTAATSTTLLGQPSKIDLTSVCPNPLVVQLDGGIDYWTLPWTSMMASDGIATPTSYQALMVDPVTREPTGISIQLRPWIPGRSKSTVDMLTKDSSIFLATTGLDGLLKSGNRSRVALVSAPWERDDVGVVWDRNAYPNISSIADFSSINNLKVQIRPNDPSRAYFSNSGLIKGSAFTQDTAPIRFTRMLDEPALLTSDPARASWQLLDEAGWSNYPHAVAVSRTSLTKYDACLRAFIPNLQQSLGVMVADPQRFAGNLSVISALMSQSIDSAVVANKIRDSIQFGIIGNGSNNTIGDVQRARIGQMERALTIGKNQLVNQKEINNLSRELAESRTKPDDGLNL